MKSNKCSLFSRGKAVERVILHIDQNCFFASVEMKNNPELRKVPMAVGGDQDQRHGIILAKNALAGAFGVRTAEAIWEARRKCPNLVVVPGHYDQYNYYSQKAYEMYCQYTDRVEPFGLDECWMDVTGSPEARDPGALADTLRSRIRDELGLSCSVGVSFNKIFAKLGSDYKKPDATTVITAENFRDIVWPLPVGELLFAGRATTSKLARINITTIGQFARLEPSFIRSFLGKNGEMLWIYANGLDESPVARCTDRRDIKSIGNSTTTAADMMDEEDVWKTIVTLSEQVAGRLRRQRRMAGTIQVHVRDNALHVYERQMRAKEATDSGEEIARMAMALFRLSYDWKNPVRSLGVRASQLSGEEGQRQISFFDPSYQTDERRKIGEVIDTLRLRYGKKIILRGVQLTRPDRDILPDGQIGWNSGGFSAGKEKEF